MQIKKGADMLDIKFLRENPEIVKQNIRNKFQDAKLPLVDEVIVLDKENREIKQEVEVLRAERNRLSKQIVAPFLNFSAKAPEPLFVFCVEMCI